MKREQILEAAKLKVQRLRKNSMMRIFGAEAAKSYWVYNYHGEFFIGSHDCENLPDFFPGKTSYRLGDNNIQKFKF